MNCSLEISEQEQSWIIVSNELGLGLVPLLSDGACLSRLAGLGKPTSGARSG